MNQEGVERVFSEAGIIARTMRKTYAYNEEKIKEILKPLGKWNDVIKVNGTALNGVVKTLPMESKKEIEKAKEVARESESFSVKKE